MLKPRQDTPDNMLRAREDKLEKFIDKEDKAEAFTQAEMDYTEDGDIESDDDIGEGFGAQAGEIPEVRTAEVKTLTPSEDRPLEELRSEPHRGRSGQRLWKESCQEVQNQGGRNHHDIHSRGEAYRRCP